MHQLTFFDTQAVKEEYSERDAELDFDQVVEFESDRFTINIPMEGIAVEGGWNVRPLARPVVRQTYDIGCLCGGIN